MLQNAAKGAFYFDTFDLVKEEILLGVMYVPNTDLVVVTCIPYDELYKSSSKIVYDVLLFFLFITTLLYIFTFIQSFSISSQIYLLTDRIKRIQKGNWDIHIESKRTDEIGELINDFNYMAKKIREMINEQYKLGLEVKSSELKALQSQINPHFLYNTLDLINWTAINNNIPEIATIVRSLSKFYKLILNKGMDTVSIATELEHMKLYIDIQNKRFKNAINFITEVDTTIYQYSIIKIILQPIVENSIIHGIMQKKEKTGIIKISGQKTDSFITLTVEDNGVGIPDDKAKTLLLSNTKDTHGYGIKNINERIRLKYGYQYGLSFNSTLGEGTKISITIPVIEYHDYE